MKKAQPRFSGPFSNIHLFEPRCSWKGVNFCTIKESTHYFNKNEAITVMLKCISYVIHLTFQMLKDGACLKQGN